MSASKKKNTLRWILAFSTVLIIATGWYFPYIGFAVPVVMMTGMVGGFFSGRWICGNLCPRGSFFDKLISPIMPRRKVPAFLTRLPVRWLIFAGLMGFMIYRLSLDITSPAYWGSVFWLMCTATTAIGLIGSIFTNSRFWCSFCPVGTVGNSFGGGKKQPLINKEKCKGCEICAKECPMLLKPTDYLTEGKISNHDCIRCGACAAKCPVEAIKMSA